MICSLSEDRNYVNTVIDIDIMKSQLCKISELLAEK